MTPNIEIVRCCVSKKLKDDITDLGNQCFKTCSWIPLAIVKSLLLISALLEVFALVGEHVSSPQAKVQLDSTAKLQGDVILFLFLRDLFDNFEFCQNKPEFEHKNILYNRGTPQTWI